MGTYHYIGQVLRCLNPIGSDKQLLCYEDAIQSDDSQNWKLAMDEEMKSLELSGTFKLIDLPEGSKWLYCVKMDSDNPICKACYCAKGYSQTHTINYFETFLPAT